MLLRPQQDEGLASTEQTLGGSMWRDRRSTAFKRGLKWICRSPRAADITLAAGRLPI
jgi:hypothetical protein